MGRRQYQCSPSFLIFAQQGVRVVPTYVPPPGSPRKRPAPIRSRTGCRLRSRPDSSARRRARPSSPSSPTPQRTGPSTVNLKIERRYLRAGGKRHGTRTAGRDRIGPRDHVRTHDRSRRAGRRGATDRPAAIERWFALLIVGERGIGVSGVLDAAAEGVNVGPVQRRIVASLCLSGKKLAPRTLQPIESQVSYAKASSMLNECYGRPNVSWV